MFAHRIVEFTGPDGVRWTEGEEPAAEGGVVIDVVATGVSYADLLQTNGTYQMKVSLPVTPGMDAAGVVRSAPPDVGLVGGQRAMQYLCRLAAGTWSSVCQPSGLCFCRMTSDSRRARPLSSTT
jgi:NADPH:quinone reductase-like Zn-dependent oxidoreductase